MGKPVKRDVVILPFPFSDLSSSKLRPALVLADVGGDDVILCMITSQQVRDEHAITLESEDFITGSLDLPSNIRPTRLFTADTAIVRRVAGTISDDKMNETLRALNSILDN